MLLFLKRTNVKYAPLLKAIVISVQTKNEWKGSSEHLNNKILVTAVKTVASAGWTKTGTWLNIVKWEFYSSFQKHYVLPSIRVFGVSFQLYRNESKQFVFNKVCRLCGAVGMTPAPMHNKELMYTSSFDPHYVLKRTHCVLLCVNLLFDPTSVIKRVRDFFENSLEFVTKSKHILW